MGINDFAKCLKRIRENRRVTQLTLAKAINCDQSMISQCETGKKLPSCPQLVNIADFFDIPLDALFDRKVSYGPPTTGWFESFPEKIREFLLKPSSKEYLDVLVQMAEDGISAEELRQVAELIFKHKSR